MSDQSTVLYDAPGPHARRRNLITAVVFVVILIAIAAYIIKVLADNGQFESDMWRPFTVAGTWTTWLLPGLWGTIKAAFASIILALVVGTLLGIGRLSDHRAVRAVCGLIVEVFRAIPVLILMFFAYYLFAKYAVVPSSQLSFAAVVFGLTLYNGSVIAEILRAGIQSVPKGQSEAALSIGMRKSQMMRMILLPQAVTAMLPALISQMVIALKDSALGYAFGYIEVVRSGIVSASYWGNYLPSLLVVAVIMIAINFCLTGLANYLERRLRSGRRRTAAPDPDVADLEAMENIPGFTGIGR
ncbi:MULTISPECIES: amino acid ABC transporter permease [Gordonia]|uniref:Glutamate ABC transporter permease protein n=2 Tax=Gordonia TaxID=2053 RepID=L7LIB9_9ACTN|nr:MULTISPECIES: amino acid ABC transporter permease [Gordonia]AUH69224.1 amino acid ABC transporter permease [Gordonia sp. YC-JH1]KJR05166.1 glutamate ABC transporter permease [Gordonia sihwensis]KXT57806.1 glutamate ABC transporter permease [Gordonia sp. QH-12]MBY4569750.1 glutamate ABC transporter permease [Gordonia sihwensis]WFN94480.1 amino acid ABC transporter permease [Gordonia sihwensis]